MSARRSVGELSVAEALFRFVEDEALPASGVTSEEFWRGLQVAIRDLGPRLSELLSTRDRLQANLDEYYRSVPGVPRDVERDKSFLREIGYLVDEPAPFQISTAGVDSELAAQAAPQLVVPLLNARYAANAANARWGSLYDALYGTDVIADVAPNARTTGYNPMRGEEVIRRGREFLDASMPLAGGSHADVIAYSVDDGGVIAHLAGGTEQRLSDPQQFVGYRGERATPTAILLVHHGLHAEIEIDRTHRIGGRDRAGVRDILLESAVTSIMDLEDSVSAVDADDKVLGYRNWHQLMNGTLTAKVDKAGSTFERTLEADREYRGVDGSSVVLPGRALMFVRQVGHFMATDAVLDANGRLIPEGFLDAYITALCSLSDIRGRSRLRNSRTGSMYVVKPKMHGPEEVALTVELFESVERTLGLPAKTIKLGIMDEERRTTVNLKACIYQARDRVVFINTGFLDRTGDEIHTSMHAGPFMRKGDLKAQPYLAAYENLNVDIGLDTGFAGRAQIGKGMWAMPDLMAAMLEQKIAHPLAGATTAWVPSPTAATLHALHYHRVNVRDVQQQLAGRVHQSIDSILNLPLEPSPSWSAEERGRELDSNVQSILGYVVRWINDGVGCSKVPDINDVGLMEDRATLRISSQLLANWLLHDIISEADVVASLHRMAPIVDSQNEHDLSYQPLLTSNGPSRAFRASLDLIVLGSQQPNGYTEPILHAARRKQKAAERK